MGKEGPCYHCGITYTPLWRNGPPEKPVLCNACGSRWRTKGTLANYVPLHARVTEKTDSSDYDGGHGKRGLTISKQVCKKRKEQIHKFQFGDLDSIPLYVVGAEDDASNGSSSASGISYSEGCVQHTITVGADKTVAPICLWDLPIPSRRRTCMYRKRSKFVSKLTKGLQQDVKDSSTSSGFSEDAIFPCRVPMAASEIGLGNCFIRQPHTTTREDESEASSLLVDNTGHYSSYVKVQEEPGEESEFVRLQIQDENLNAKEHKIPKAQEKKLRGGPEYELDPLKSCYSPLIFVELKDIVNYESFMDRLTREEQEHLVTFVSTVDSSDLPESLVSMFKSIQFEEALDIFQKLLSEGIFDRHVSGPHPQFKHTLQKYIMTDLKNSKWIDIYHNPKTRNNHSQDMDFTNVLNSKESRRLNEPSFPFTSETYHAVKRSLGSQAHKVPIGYDDSMKRPEILPKNIIFSGHYKTTHFGQTTKDLKQINVKSEPKPGINAGFASYLASSLLDPEEDFAVEGSEKDLLLDVPSSTSFPQAELLNPPVLKPKTYKDSLTTVKNVEYPKDKDYTAGNLWDSEESQEWSDIFWSPSNML